MKNTKEFTKEWFDILRKEIEKNLMKLCDGLGYDCKAGNIQYTPGIEFSVKLNFLKKATENFDPKQEIWNSNCELFGLDFEMYGRIINIEGKQFRISGIKPNAKRNVVVIKRISDGKEYVTSASNILRALREISEP